MKEKREKKTTYSLAQSPTIFGCIVSLFFFFFTLLPIKNKLDETRSKNLRRGKNGDLLCFSNKITSHESSAPYLLEKKKKALLKSHAGRKKKKGRRNTGLEIRYFSCPSLFFPSLSLSLNRAHILAESYTHVTKTHTRTNAKEKKKGNRKKKERGEEHTSKPAGYRSTVVFARLPSPTYLSSTFHPFSFFFSFFFLWCLVRVVAVLVVAAEAVGAIVHVVLHKHQIAVALRVPRHDLVHRSPPRQVPRLQPLFLRV